jgi:hypothetical protein
MGRLRLPFVLACALSLAGCLARDRLNTRCEWTDDGAVQLNLQHEPDRRHLNNDVEIAEELGIRYGDSFRSRAGLPETRRRRTECTATLFAQISRVHGVTSNDVEQARGQRPAGMDVLVLLSFAMLYAFLSSKLVRGIFSRHPIDEPLPALVAVALVSATAGVGAVMALPMWGEVFEIVRRADGHGSYRVGRLPWGHHMLELFGAGVVLFCLIAAGQAVMRKRSNP